MKSTTRRDFLKRFGETAALAAAVAGGAGAAVFCGCSPLVWYGGNYDENDPDFYKEYPWLYSPTPLFIEFRTLCEHHKIAATDWHVHVYRGEMTPAKALERAAFAPNIKNAVVENHGVEWPLSNDAKLAEYIEKVHAEVAKQEKALPVGIQVNDRDWHTRTDRALLAKLDYVLADTMIMGTTLTGKPQRLWLLDKAPLSETDADAWFAKYYAHTLAVVREPISILANPTYLPECVAAQYARLWTPERMREVALAAVANDVRLEIQASSEFPKIEFLKIAKDAGAKFTFGSNNFDDKPPNVGAWLRGVRDADLKGTDFAPPAKKF
jgi:histidinol phosphatase-like PHP family hydrolase